MKIVIKATNLKLTSTLHQYIGEKINSLEKSAKILYNEKRYNHFFGKGKPGVESWVEIEKTTRHHQKGFIFCAEVQLKFPGQSLRVKTCSENLQRAITEAKDKLQRQLKQYKNKLIIQSKRRARVAKKELKTSPQARFYRKGRIRKDGT